MINIADFAKKIINVCELLDAIEVKGVSNMTKIQSAYKECESILIDIKETMEEYQNEHKEQNSADEVGEQNAE